MSLSQGTKLGPYEVVSKLGAGGMGGACGPASERSETSRGAWGWSPTPVMDEVRTQAEDHRWR